jgi:fibronectin type 3 domain-containing protein
VNSAGASDQSKPGVSATTILNAPTNVQAATQSSSTGIIVSWEKVSGATGYKVYRSNGGESGEYTLRTGSTPLDRTSYTDNSVSAGITYYYKVSAVNGNVNVKESVYSSAASVTTKLNAPANVTATAQSSSSIEISWDPVLGATSYRVYRSDNGQSDTYKEIAKDVTAPSYPDDKDLSAATTYYYTVSTVNDGGEGAKSSAKFATTKPNTPTGVEAAAKSTYSIEISWDVPVSHASAIYNVYGLNSESGEYDRLNNNVNVSIQGNKYLYTKTGLSAGTTYSYKISRTIGNVESAQSVAVSATTKLAAPTGVQATAQSSSSIEISWTEVTGATSYTVYRSESQSGIYTEEIAKDLTTILYTDDTGLSPEKTYYYKVSTVNNGGEGDQSGHASATTKPSAPTGVTAEAESSTSIKISWTAKSGASSYKVYRSDSVDGDYTALSSAASLTTTSHTDSYNLSVGTTYYYKVSWVNNSGVESDKSAAVSATTSDSP